MDTKARYEELKSLLTRYSDLYYNEDNPEITDFEYDALMQELKALEREHPELTSADSPTQKVGGSAKRTAGVLIDHRVPMLSMQDLFTKEEIVQFVRSTKEKLGQSVTFAVETKIDGLSMALRYENGKLTTAITRGDGRRRGEDVTQNALVIEGIPAALTDAPEYLELRGEVYMSRGDFKQTNVQQELAGKKPFANPRNCAAGTLRQLDSEVVRSRGLRMFIFNVQDARGVSFRLHSEAYAYLKAHGLPVIEHSIVCSTEQEVLDAIDRIGALRGSLDYDIDGAVVKLNDLSLRPMMPDTAKNAGYMVAYKYPPEEKETVLRAVELSVGRTGRVTPTAVFDPVYLCGTTVSRATLHNQDYINGLDLGVGDTIVVFKSGEIIPKVKSVLHEKRPAGTVRYHLPELCPVCGARLVREEDTADLKCVSPDCSAQTERRIINFVSRDAMDIRGLGEITVQELTRLGYVSDPGDLYTLHLRRDELVEAGVIGKDKNTDKVLAQIEASKKNDLSRLLAGLGIPNIGKSGAKALAAVFGSMDAIIAASPEKLEDVPDIGGISAEAVASFFRNGKNLALIDRLRSEGVNMISLQAADAGSGEKPFAGMTFVITGTLPTMSREEASDYITARGGKVAGSVSGKTRYLLAGENAGSKLAKAQSLGVSVITEDELISGVLS